MTLVVGMPNTGGRRIMHVQKTGEFWCEDIHGGRVKVLEYTEITNSTATPGKKSLITAEGDPVNALENGSFQIIRSGMYLRQTDA